MPGEADKVGDSTSKFAMKKQVETGGKVNLIKRIVKEHVASRRIMSKDDMERAQLKREMELKDKKEKVEARKMLKANRKKRVGSIETGMVQARILTLMGKYGSTCMGGKTGSKRKGVDELGMTMKYAIKGRKEDTCLDELFC